MPAAVCPDGNADRKPALSELWNLFDFLMPGYLYTNHAFREKLEKPILKSKNPDAVSQLRRLVQPFLLRRLKK